MKAYLFNKLPRDGMEALLCLREVRQGKFTIYACDGAQNWAIELHATLDDTRAVKAGNPLRGRFSELARGRRRRVLEGDLVEAHADLGVLGRGKAVERAQEANVRGGKSRVRGKLLEEDDCGRM